MTTPGRTTKRSQPFPLSMLIVAVLAVVVSAVTSLRVYGMPAEARNTQTWYTYQSSVGFDFLANVTPGKYYADPVVRAEDLVRNRLPVDPPVYHRVLISKLTDSIDVKIPYHFKADRVVPTNVRWRIEGRVVIPGVWQKSYPMLDQRELPVQGTEISGVETIHLPISEFVADMDTGKNNIGVSLEPMEIHIHPVMEVDVATLRQPVKVVNDPEFVIVVRSSTVEMDDPRANKVDQTLSESRVIPFTVPIFGSDIKVATLRRISIFALGGFLFLGLVLAWLGRRKPDNRSLIEKLGPNLIRSNVFEMPVDAAFVQLNTAKELLHLHLQTESPVIQVDYFYYLLDGTTCYRLNLSEDPAKSAAV